jgi:hypothetical protein
VNPKLYNLTLPKEELQIFLKVAQRMKELLATPEQWIKRTEAKNAAGEKVPALSREACKFCLLGAATRAVRDICVQDDGVRLPHCNRVYVEVVPSLALLLPKEYQSTCEKSYSADTLAIFNDSYFSTHDQVLELLENLEQSVLQLLKQFPEESNNA